MKIGLISDIHCHLDALQRALALLEQKGVDQIICAGDLVEKGAHGDEVVGLIRKRAIPCVQGNHDRDAIFNQRWMRKHMDINHPEVRARLLSDESIEYLRQLPQTLRFMWEGKRVLLAHGAPWSRDEYIFHKSPPERIRQVIQEAQSDIVILGHTHIPMHLHMDGAHILNPGSVWSDFLETYRTCAVLSLPDCVYEVFDIGTGERVTLPYTLPGI